MDGTAEEHLRIGALEDAGDAGAPLELLLDGRPDGLMSSLGILDLLLPELGEPLPDSRAPVTERARRRPQGLAQSRQRERRRSHFCHSAACNGPILSIVPG